MISHYVVYFAIYSFMGWIYECFFAIATKHEWENRGFMFGPVIPIYGVGGVSIMILLRVCEVYHLTPSVWQLFLIGAFGSVILEFSTHLFLEKMFHAYWWDYSNMPFNIQGRVCLPYTICFGGAAILVAKVIAPFTVHMVAWMPDLLFEGLAFLFVAIFAMDLALTVSILADFDRKVASVDESFNQTMEKVIEGSKAAMSRAIFTREWFANYLSGLDSIKKGALKRMRGYRNPKVEKNNMDEFFSSLKNHLPKMKQ
ncbi:putative ABC transporter permease [Agathobacter ruminis]|uniref:Metal-dependent phosphohydrolase n=1 Tax=Agathobacter ruminis TaxID=1712665 RepID=A0A2G3E161_9FIRM|nr:putative ABC transporter permease [Agathobacter ruminis]MDC7302432.1 putative ABC transporter permease [Agathobacter ruminis]PHU36961.1 metal-dependent phosphohydrolase [Agathobacter ruminis]